MENILGRERNDVHMANIIKGNITNADEVLKSDKEVSFEEQINKGEVDVVSMEDVKDTYGNVFYKGEDVATVEANIEALIKKGEDNYLEQEEFDALEKAMGDFSKLERKAVAVPRGNSQSYREIFVIKSEEVTED